VTDPYSAEEPRTVAERIGDDQTGPMVPKDNAPGDTSDGFHTFDELYAHREALTMVLATIAAIDEQSWRSKAHHPDDTPIFDGFFIVGIDLPTGVISYHYPLASWDNFSGVPVLEHAPKWDGATPDDTVYRLRGFAGHLRIAIEEGREAQEAARVAADAVVEAAKQPDAVRPTAGVIACRVDETVGATDPEEFDPDQIIGPDDILPEVRK